MNECRENAVLREALDEGLRSVIVDMFRIAASDTSDEAVNRMEHGIRQAIKVRAMILTSLLGTDEL